MLRKIRVINSKKNTLRSGEDKIREIMVHLKLYKILFRSKNKFDQPIFDQKKFYLN